MRDLYTDLGKAEKKKLKENAQRENEERLRASVDGFRRKASEDAAEELLDMGIRVPRETVKAVVSRAINQHSPDLGLKAEIDSQKKKILWA